MDRHSESSSRFARRNFLYILLIAFICVGLIIDVLFDLYRTHALTWNDAIQIIGILILILMWQKADAAALNVRPSYISKILTVLFAPLGLAVYFFQSRNWKSAIVSFLLFWIGFIAPFFVMVLFIEWIGIS